MVQADDDLPEVWVHESALIEEDVQIGPGTKVWDHVHIRHGARIGRRCIIGEKAYIAYDVRIGSFCKLNASVYICAGVEIEDFVMISAHTVFTNDLLPRAGDPERGDLLPSDPDEHTLRTLVRRGATIGANATIGPGIELGAYSMVGMGSVVTREVLPHRLVVGNPAKAVGYVCICGGRLFHSPADPAVETCTGCGISWRRDEGGMLSREGDPSR